MSEERGKGVGQLHLYNIITRQSYGPTPGGSFSSDAEEKLPPWGDLNTHYACFSRG